MDLDLYDRLIEGQEYLHNRGISNAPIGIVLGTGLGGLVQEMVIEIEVPYADIPYMPQSTVAGHAGKLLRGKIAGVDVIALSGRFHYYEGYNMQEVTFGIRLLKQMGVQRLLLSNVAGGLQADMEPGELVLLRDHINLMPAHPLRGHNDERLGPRFPDMMYTYDREMNQKIRAKARMIGIRVREGVYVVLQGPSLETPAEYNFLHLIGGDVVGMSTVPEVLVARHMEIKVNVLSVVSNVCYPIENLTPTSLEDVIAVAKEATPKLTNLVKAILPDLL